MDTCAIPTSARLGSPQCTETRPGAASDRGSPRQRGVPMGDCRVSVTFPRCSIWRAPPVEDVEPRFPAGEHCVRPDQPGRTPDAVPSASAATPPPAPAPTPVPTACTPGAPLIGSRFAYATTSSFRSVIMFGWEWLGARAGFRMGAQCMNVRCADPKPGGGPVAWWRSTAFTCNARMARRRMRIRMLPHDAADTARSPSHRAARHPLGPCMRVHQ